MTSCDFKRRGAAERVKIHVPVSLKYRFREDRNAGYLELTFDRDTVLKLTHIFGVVDDDVWLRFRMLPSGLLHIQNDPSGVVGYKMTKDGSIQISSLQTANIPEPPNDALHRVGITATLSLNWTPDADAFIINIPKSLFVAEQRGGDGKKHPV